MKYWLMKTEPNSFSIDDLERAGGKTTSWDGVRNYQARNFMRKMRVGDEVLFYHSNADPPAVVGIVRVVKEAYPDHTAFDPSDKHYDPGSKPDHPRWDMVDIRFKRKFRRRLSLPELREQPGLLRMELLRKGSRLSVQPVLADEWKIILKLAR
ncbi:MAG: EVE domain-containing protein [Acidobacteriota bacterium]